MIKVWHWNFQLNVFYGLGEIALQSYKVSKVRLGTPKPGIQSKFIKFLELCIFGSTNPRKILLYAETPPGMIIEKGKLSIQRNW